jgi:hypothetical protein
VPEVERALREKVRQRIQSGALPRAKPNRTWGGPGAGLICAVCDQRITRDQIEYEVQFVQEGVSAPQICHLHLACFAAWELERGLMMRAGV